MIEVHFPEPQFRTKKEGNQHFIFDNIRKSWILLTDEEWVRQNFVNYMIQNLAYPSTVIALEKELLLNGQKKRFDILVYDHAFQPWLMVECKAASVKLSEDVLQQALRYNITLPVPYIVITNGSHTIGWKKNNRSLEQIHAMPLWIKSPLPPENV
jgi:type I site-specific restriction endonuclease